MNETTGRGGEPAPAIPRPRRLWQLLEPFHALTYFAPEARDAFERVGLRGFWRGYFAGRAAPMGAVGPGVVAACFFGFHPAFVERALPSVWSMASPETALAARLRGVGTAAVRIFGTDIDDAATEAAAILERALASAGIGGRPLFAANATLDWPSTPHLALWHAATLLREHRGDGHVIALTGAGLGPCEAHVSRVAADGNPPESIQPYRGWTTDDWQAAAGRLRERGWMDDHGALTETGVAVRGRVEHDTDRLAAAVTDQLTEDEARRLTRILEPIARQLRGDGVIPYPNPIGVPPPT